MHHRSTAWPNSTNGVKICYHLLLIMIGCYSFHLLRLCLTSTGLSIEFFSLPSFRSNRAISMCPFCTAGHITVRPPESTASTVAPFSTRSCTTALCPFSAAQNSAVRIFGQTTSTAAPFFSRNRTTAFCLFSSAQRSAAGPFESMAPCRSHELLGPREA